MYCSTVFKLELQSCRGLFGCCALNNLVCQCTGRQFQWPPVKSRMRRRNTRNDTRQTQHSEYLNVSLNSKLHRFIQLWQFTQMRRMPKLNMGWVKQSFIKRWVNSIFFAKLHHSLKYENLTIYRINQPACIDIFYSALISSQVTFQHQTIALRIVHFLT